MSTYIYIHKTIKIVEYVYARTRIHIFTNEEKYQHHTHCHEHPHHKMDQHSYLQAMTCYLSNEFSLCYLEHEYSLAIKRDMLHDMMMVGLPGKLLPPLVEEHGGAPTEKTDWMGCNGECCS